MERLTHMMVAAPAQLPTISVDQGGWLGNISAAGVGAVLLWGSNRLMKANKGPWGPFLESKLSNVKFDWKSTMSFIIGFMGVTLLLGSGDNWLRNALTWIQSLLTGLGNIDLFAAFGMAAFCVVAVIKIYADANDPEKDMRWGMVCAVLFPLGGGIFAQASLYTGGLLAGALNGTL